MPPKSRNENKIVRPATFELFAGAGGLGLGMAKSGFRNAGVLEWNAYACETMRENQREGHPLVADWHVHQADARTFEYSSLNGVAEVVSGGPPCQPFSMGGKHQAFLDSRDMFPQAIRAVREIQPKAFIFENVRGLTRCSFRNYFNYILLQMEFPMFLSRPDESWTEHLARLEKLKTSGGSSSDLKYNVVARVLNAANYGVPQKRERVFFVGFRSDLGIEWSFPSPTHSEESLLHAQWVTGEYWDFHRVPKTKRPEIEPRAAKRVERMRDFSPTLIGERWQTVRDALRGLSDPRKRPDSASNHVFQPGARSYPGHTGSPLDQPAKTLKAGDHGVPGGENMLRYPDGSLRYFSVRESARLQTFPDDYAFHGAWTEAMRQLGNAVPVKLAQSVASSVAQKMTLQKCA